MSDRIKWIEHKGLKILLIDYTDLPENEFVNEIQNTERAMLECVDKVIYVIAKMVNVRMTDVAKEAGQTAVENVKARGINIQPTMVGLSKLQRIIANAVIKDVYFAKDEEDAKEWLVKQAEKVNQTVG